MTRSFRTAVPAWSRRSTLAAVLAGHRALVVDAVTTGGIRESWRTAVNAPRTLGL